MMTEKCITFLAMECSMAVYPNINSGAMQGRFGVRPTDQPAVFLRLVEL